MNDPRLALLTELDRLDALAATASPGAWTYSDDTWSHDAARYGDDIDGLVANVVTVESRDIAMCPGGDVPPGEGRNAQARGDAAFVAANQPSAVLARNAAVRDLAETHAECGSGCRTLARLADAYVPGWRTP